MRITVVIDNSPHDRHLASEWGLSVWLETGPAADGDCRHVLVDSGASALSLSNARALGLPLAALEAVVLSHGHYDHGGGLPELAAQAPDARYVLHPGALNPRYLSQGAGGCRPIGLPEASRASLCAGPGRLQLITEPTEVVPGVWASGPIPRLHALEGPEPGFFLDEAGTVPDYVVDDQAVWVETGSGLVIVTGCAHAGLINTVRYVVDAAGSRRDQTVDDHDRQPGRDHAAGEAVKVRAVIGGFHLLHASEERLKATAEFLNGLRLELCAPCHCTGDRGQQVLRERLDEAWVEIGSGSRFTFRAPATPPRDAGRDCTASAANRPPSAD